MTEAPQLNPESKLVGLETSETVRRRKGFMIQQHTCAAGLIDQLEEIYRTQDFKHIEEAGRFTTALLQPKPGEGPTHDRGVLAVIFYGSCLNQGMESQDSTPDYYVIVDNYHQFYGHGWKNSVDRILNAYFPPNIYRWHLAKYSVISLTDLLHETSFRALDVYHVGRFSKRLAIAFVKEPWVLAKIVEACCKAMEVAMARALPLLPSAPQRFTLADAIRVALRISYIGEPRVEADDKIEKIYRSQTTFYHEMFGRALSCLCKHLNWLSFDAASATYTQSAPPEKIAETTLFIARSRKRSYFRWPKYLWTVDHWVEYMLAKVERTKGIKIEPTAHERRYYLIYAWKYFWILRKKKLFK